MTSTMSGYLSTKLGRSKKRRLKACRSIGSSTCNDWSSYDSHSTLRALQEGPFASPRCISTASGAWALCCGRLPTYSSRRFFPFAVGSSKRFSGFWSGFAGSGLQGVTARLLERPDEKGVKRSLVEPGLTSHLLCPCLKFGLEVLESRLRDLNANVANPVPTPAQIRLVLLRLRLEFDRPRGDRPLTSLVWFANVTEISGFGR